MKLIYETLSYSSDTLTVSSPGEDVVCVGINTGHPDAKDQILLSFLTESLLKMSSEVMQKILSYITDNWLDEMRVTGAEIFIQSGHLFFHLNNDESGVLIPVQSPGEVNGSLQAFKTVLPFISSRLLDTANAAKGVFVPSGEIATAAS